MRKRILKRPYTDADPDTLTDADDDADGDMDADQPSTLYPDRSDSFHSSISDGPARPRMK